MSSSEAECTCCVCCGGYAGIISESNSEIYEILLFGSCCDGSLAQDEAEPCCMRAPAWRGSAQLRVAQTR